MDRIQPCTKLLRNTWFVNSQNDALNIKGKKQTKKKNIYSGKHKYPSV